jgi:hypothetical protein
MPRSADNDLIQFLIVAGIALVTALYNWLKKRRPPPDEAGPPPAPARPVVKTESWEEELRRLLQGEEESPPPPIILREAPRPEPPPLPRPALARPPARIVRPGAEEEEPMDRGLPVPLPGLARSAEAYARGSQLESRVAEQLRRVGELVTSHARIREVRTLNPAAVRVRTMLRGRDSLRTAVVASLILGPPKGFEG